MNKNQIIKNSKIGKNTVIYEFVNIYGCKIGNDSQIGTFVEIQKDVVIGNNVKIQSHSFVCSGVIIEDNVFIGHHVVFVNDKYPRVLNSKGIKKTDKDWTLLPIVIKKGASIGSNATIMGGLTIGENAMVGAGSVVTKNVKDNEVVVGVPAKKIKKINVKK